MAEIPSTMTVGNVFCEQYYTLLRLKPEESHKFYENSSVASWDDSKDSVTTHDGIREMIMASNFKDCLVEVEDVHSQDSLQGSILVVVTGCATGKDNSQRKFSQSFVLAKHKTGYFVMNDILRFVDDKEPKSPLAADSELARASGDVCIQVKESSAADGKSVSEESIDVKVTAEVVAETRPEQTVSEVVVVSDTKDAAPKSSYLEMLSRGKTSSTPAPATRFVRVSALDGLSGQEKAKLLAAHNGSRKAMAVASTPNNVTKNDEIPPTPTKTTAETIRAPKGIYVGGLAPNTTISDLSDAVKKFGKFRKFEGVQVIVLPDRYCYGFVHFQSADSAKKAVESQSITVNGKEAYISYKRSGRNARAAEGNDNRGRSPSGRGKSESRAPSCNGHSSNGEAHHSGGNQHNNNGNGHRSSDGSGGEADGWSDPRRRRRRDQRGSNGLASKKYGGQNDHRRSNGEDHRSNTTAAVTTSQQ